MSGSIIGKNFQISTWGESHGAALGVVIDGCPAGIALCEEDIQKDLDLRKPGSNKFGTQRKESDTVHILSGVFEGKTTGTPISLVVYNENQKSRDYSNIMNVFRPGHADYTFYKKYGFRIQRRWTFIGERDSLPCCGRCRCEKNTFRASNSFITYSKEIAGFSSDKVPASREEVFDDKLYMADSSVSEKAAEYLNTCIENHDSAGGIVECIIKNVPAGLGETVFDKLDASLAKAVFSLGAVKGFEIGAGFGAAKLNGSSNNDPFTVSDGKVVKKTNNAGGILGGMSDGSDIVFRAAFKPTPSIFKEQETVDIDGNITKIEIKGRHDPIIVPRAVIVVEAMAAITLTDLLFSNMFARIDNIKKFYSQM